MPDQLGNITIPEITASGTFPLKVEPGSSRVHKPNVIVHTFGSANQKVEQRFKMGSGARRFKVVCNKLSESQKVTLRSFWETNQGAYGAFALGWPTETGSGGYSNVNYTVHFENEALSFEQLTDSISRTGVTMVEIPTTTPSYTVTGTDVRFPSSSLATAMLSQEQEMIPLVKIQSLEPGYPAVYISDRRLSLTIPSVGTGTWTPRLLELPTCTQAIDGRADNVTLKLGNADRAITALLADTDIENASVEYSLFHVGTSTLLNFWAGSVVDFQTDASEVAQIICSDVLYQITLPYPQRLIDRSCWKRFNDGQACPYATQGSGGDPLICDHGWNTPKGCVSHGMNNYFGGIPLLSQPVRIKDNSDGGKSITATSITDETVFGEALPQVYTDVPLKVKAKIVEARDESEFFNALGIVSKGPIGAYGRLTRTGIAGAADTYVDHELDGQNWHGFPKNRLGLREILGTDPATDSFSLGQVSGPGMSSYAANRAAGVAAVELRRSDLVGIQPTLANQHVMEVIVASGVKGKVWTATGTATSQTLSTPAWVAINTYLEAIGQEFASTAAQELRFDVQAAIDAAAICNLSAARIIDSGTDAKQYRFIGVIGQQKPYRDWLAEILLNMLGYYVFVFNRLYIGCRVNASAVESFTAGNMLANSLSLGHIKPQANRFTAIYADEELEYASNTISYQDDRHIELRQRKTSADVSLAGTSRKSQAARIILARGREEVGGYTAAEYRKARKIAFKSTILACGMIPGKVYSVTDAEIPGGSQNFRCEAFTLNSDLSVDITGQTVTASMYDYVNGPKPADVIPSPVPEEPETNPADWGYEVYTKGDGTITLHNLYCATNALTVAQLVAETYYVPETEVSLTLCSGGVDNNNATISYAGRAPVIGTAVAIGKELMFVGSVTPATDNSGSFDVARGVYGSTAVAHPRITGTITAIQNTQQFTVTAGLNFDIGSRIVVPSGAQQDIAYYDPGTGTIATVLPFDDGVLNVGDAVYADPCIYPIYQQDATVQLQPKFFRSSVRATFETSIEIPNAGVVLVRAYLQNAAGLRSELVTRQREELTYVRWRTLGGPAGYVLQHPDVPSGETLDAFERIIVTEPHSVSRVYALRTTPNDEGPITQPSSLTAIAPVSYTAGVTITLGGTVTVGSRLTLLAGTAEDDRNYVEVPTFEVSVQSTLAAVADAWVSWLNGTEDFFSYYSAVLDGTNPAKINIVDKVGLGGTITINRQGTVTATLARPTGLLEIMEGRRYACAYYSGSLALQSELSLLSESTGPTGGATKIELKDLPHSADSRVSTLNIYATPDGKDTPYYHIGFVLNGGSYFADTTTEAALTAKTLWGGAIQPSATGEIIIHAKRDGSDWFRLVIPTISAGSNLIDGVALRGIAPGTEITADIKNGAGSHSLRVVME